MEKIPIPEGWSWEPKSVKHDQQALKLIMIKPGSKIISSSNSDKCDAIGLT